MTDEAPSRDLTGLRRASGLKGKLVPGRTTVSAAETAEPEAAVPEQVSAGGPPLSAPRRTPRRPQKPATEDRPVVESWRKQNYPAYLPGSVRNTMTETKGTRSMGEWILDAYDAVNDQLTERFPQARASASGLPPRTARPRSRVEEPRETALRLTGDEIEVLEARRVELGGPNRSEYVTAIAELYIEQLRRT